jgi:hypothetical protein
VLVIVPIVTAAMDLIEGHDADASHCKWCGAWL